MKWDEMEWDEIEWHGIERSELKHEICSLSSLDKSMVHGPWSMVKAINPSHL
jgi:hypothetical protein